jgi:hypothetical protein
MKPVKITAEITLTPEMFKEWNEGVLPETEPEYHHFIEKVVYGKFAYGLNIGKYKDFINKTIEDNGDGLKVTIEELK